MKSKIQNILVKAIKKINSNIDEDINIEVPADKSNGDYSSNIALKLAKILKDNPLNIASKIVEQIDSEDFLKIDIAPPGFINFYLKKDYLLDNINTIIKLGNDYGRNNIGNAKKVNVEFVSANPTGIIHVGTSRCAAYGDSICRILSFAGYDVIREYYFNDGGVQIENLGKSLQARYQEQCGLEVNFPENGYHGHEIIDIAKEIKEKYNEDKLNKDYTYFSKYASDYLIEIIKEDLKDFRVTFDVWTSEQEFRTSGKIDECLSLLREKDDLYEMDGATWLKTTKYGDDKDRVIVKSDGNYTYLVPDIAYHLDKINRGFEEIIDVLGADHHGYVGRLKASVEALGYNPQKIHIKMVQMVKLLRNGEEVKMSKRTGQTITMRELIEEIGVNAARYFLSSRSVDTQMDFDLDLAKKNASDNPVFYVCYAYARVCTILEDQKLTPIKNFKHISSEEAFNVLEILYKFPEVVEKAAIKHLPHLITNYVYDVANSFHIYYSKNRILCENEELTNENLHLLKAVKITLETALNLVGVIPPKKM